MKKIHRFLGFLLYAIRCTTDCQFARAAWLDMKGLLPYAPTLNCCGNFGITCANPNVINSIRWDGSFFSPSKNISAVLGNLTELTSLTLNNFNIQGTIPSFIFTLSKIKLIDLGNCNLVGPITCGFSSLKNLETLNLAGNNLNETIPLDITNSSIKILSLQGNQLSGPLGMADDTYVSRITFCAVDANKFCLPQGSVPIFACQVLPSCAVGVTFSNSCRILESSQPIPSATIHVLPPFSVSSTVQGSTATRSSISETSTIQGSTASISFTSSPISKTHPSILTIPITSRITSLPDLVASTGSSLVTTSSAIDEKGSVANNNAVSLSTADVTAISVLVPLFAIICGVVVILMKRRYKANSRKAALTRVERTKNPPRNEMPQSIGAPSTPPAGRKIETLAQNPDNKISMQAKATATVNSLPNSPPKRNVNISDATPLSRNSLAPTQKETFKRAGSPLHLLGSQSLQNPEIFHIQMEKLVQNPDNKITMQAKATPTVNSLPNSPPKRNVDVSDTDATPISSNSPALTQRETFKRAGNPLHGRPLQNHEILNIQGVTGVHVQEEKRYGKFQKRAPPLPPLKKE